MVGGGVCHACTQHVLNCGSDVHLCTCMHAGFVGHYACKPRGAVEGVVLESRLAGHDGSHKVCLPGSIDATKLPTTGMELEALQHLMKDVGEVVALRCKHPSTPITLCNQVLGVLR
eukprot:353464-Chlamydomonas_euryale.AAC.3